MERNLESQLQKEQRDILIKAGVIEGRKDFYFAFLWPQFLSPSALALQRQRGLEYLKNDTVHTTHLTHSTSNQEYSEKASIY